MIWNHSSPIPKKHDEDTEDDVEDAAGLLFVQEDKVKSMLKMLQMMLRNVGLILVNFLSRKVQSKKHVEDTEEDVEECWFNIGLLLVQESTKCLA